jgi:hypothetical protein
LLCLVRNKIIPKHPQTSPNPWFITVSFFLWQLQFRGYTPFSHIPYLSKLMANEI